MIQMGKQSKGHVHKAYNNKVAKSERLRTIGQAS